MNFAILKRLVEAVNIVTPFNRIVEEGDAIVVELVVTRSGSPFGPSRTEVESFEET